MMKHPSVTKRLLILSVALSAGWLLAASQGVRAQESKPEAASAVARKIDEFGRVGGCDHSARLDNFTIELQNNPGARGLIVAYGPAGEGSGTADSRLAITKEYLVNSRGIEAERLKTVNGGRYEKRGESVSVLWLVPPGAEEPELTKYETDAASFNGMFAEGPRWDGRYMADGGTGPPVGNAVMAGFTDSLRLQPKALAYVVAFNGKESMPGAWRRVAEDDAEDLRRNGVEADRIKIVFGGYAEEEETAKAQLWILPPDAPPPAADAGPERTPSEAMQLGTYPEAQLRDEADARWVFKAFADVLKADNKMNAYIVVRLPFAGTSEADEGEGENEGESAEATAEPAEVEVASVEGEVGEDEEPPEINLAELVEQWKARLKKEYGIGDERLTVVFVPAHDEWNADEIEAWVVPQGAAMPDPFAVEDEEAGEETEGEEAEPAEDDPRE